MSAPPTPNRPAGWVRGCTGKQAFGSHGHAAQRAKRMRQNHGAPLIAYHCKHCRQFHVGTDDGYEKRHERARRKDRGGER